MSFQSVKSKLLVVATAGVVLASNASAAIDTENVSFDIANVEAVAPIVLLGIAAYKGVQWAIKLIKGA